MECKKCSSCIKSNFAPDHWEDLKKSQLDCDTIKQVKFWSCSKDRDKLGEIYFGNKTKINKENFVFRQVTSALVIPYPDVDFYRLKLFPTTIRDEKGKKKKYHQFFNSRLYLYIPPNIKEYLKDPTIPIYWIEGEKKTLFAWQNGLICCIGIGGLWSWIQDGTPIYGIGDINHDNRDEFLIPDSDVFSHESNILGVYAFGKDLEDRGSNFKIIKIPQIGSQKKGLDDLKIENIHDWINKSEKIDLNYKAFGKAKKWYPKWEQKDKRKKREDKTIEIPEEIHYTDVGNAKRLVLRYGKNLHYCYSWKQWLIWNNKYWEIDRKGKIVKLAKETIMSLYQKASEIKDETERKNLIQFAFRSEAKPKIDAMIDLAKSETNIPLLPSDFDTNEYLLNARNGTIDLISGLLQPHNREDLITKMIPVEYDPNADDSKWVTFLNEIMDNDQGLIDYLQKIIGYSLTGNVTEDAIFFLYGTGSNGKTTFLQTIRNMLGEYAISVVPEIFLLRKGEIQNSTEIADFEGRRLIITAETEEGKYLSEALVNRLTGKEAIRARHLYQDSSEFLPTHKIFISTNHKPIIRGTDHAIWRRIHLIPFTVKFDDEDENSVKEKTEEEIVKKGDKLKMEELKKNWSGILAWAVKGCLKWKEYGIKRHAKVEQATKKYREEMDIIAQFIEDCCIIKIGAEVQCKALYQEYVQWCLKQSNIPLKTKKFSLRLKEKDFVNSIGTGGYYHWKDIGLLTSNKEEEKKKESNQEELSKSKKEVEYAHVRPEAKLMMEELSKSEKVEYIPRDPKFVEVPPIGKLSEGTQFTQLTQLFNCDFPCLENFSLRFDPLKKKEVRFCNKQGRFCKFWEKE